MRCKRVIIALIMLSTGMLLAQTPRTMNYQGKLTDAVGVAITGDHAIEFRIYDSETGGVLLWSEEHLAVTLTNGLFDIILGETTAMNLPFDEQYWIEIEIDGETLTPREKFASVAYAHRAVYADTAEYVTGGGVADDDWTRVGNIVHAYNTTDTIGIGTTSPSGGKLVVLDNTEGTGIHLEAEPPTIDGSVRNSPKLSFTDSYRWSGFPGTHTSSIYTSSPSAGSNRLLNFDNGLTKFTMNSSAVEFQFEGDFQNWPNLDMIFLAPRVTSGYGNGTDVILDMRGQYWNGSASTVRSAKITHEVEDDGTSSMNFKIQGDATRMTILSGGNVGIGTATPAAKLDINGTTRMTGFEMPTSAVNGYVLTTDAAGNGTWQPSSGGSSDAWLLAGNAGTTSGTDFIGTTDAQDLDFRVNNDIKLTITEKGQLETNGTEETGYVLIGQGAGENQTGVGTYGVVFIGHEAGMASENANGTVAIGYEALHTNTTGDYNTAIGWGAMKGDGASSGLYNTAVGYQALNQNNNDQANTAIGYSSMFGNTGGNNNTAVGYNSLLNNCGDYNTAVGWEALDATTSSATFNTAIGKSALGATTDGTYNTAVGANALLYNETGTYNTAVGNMAGPASGSTGLTNTVAIGNNAVPTASNEVRLGNGSISSLYCQGAYAATTASEPNLYVSSSGQIMRSTASIGSPGDYIQNQTATNQPADFRIDGHGYFYGDATSYIDIYASSTDQNIVSTDQMILVSAEGIKLRGPYTQIQTSTAVPYVHFDGTNQRMGIGTTSPSYDLHVAGSARVNSLNINGAYSLPPSAGTTSQYLCGDGTWGTPSAGGSGWSLTGNSGTVDGTNFVGTTDNVPLSFRVNNIQSGRLASNSTFLGYNAGRVATGINNVLIGEGAGYYLTSGEHNTAIGHNALYGYMSDNVGDNNVAIGWDAMFYTTNKNSNVAIGKSALSLPPGGPIEETVAIGYYADQMPSTVPTNSVALGARTKIGAENSIAIGYRASAPNAHTLVLGSIAGVNDASNTIKAGVGTNDIRARLHIDGGFAIGNGNAISSTHGVKRSIQIATDTYYGGANDNHSGYLIYSIMPGGWGTGELRFACATEWGVYNTTTPALRITQSGIYANGTYYSSDRRIKSDFREMPYGLEQIMALEPLYYSKHIAKDMADGKPILGESSDEIGFIAQDLYKIIPEVVSKPNDENNELWGIDYAKMVPVLVQAIQEQQAQIEALEARIEALENK